jgi:ribonuclease HI
MNKSMMDYEIYTDGSCLKNPGVGAFAFIIIDNKSKNLYIKSKYYDETTNNQMEMLSSIFAMKYCSDNIDKNQINNKYILFTDSQYLKNGINDWIIKWKKNNWRTSLNADVKNKDLWIQIDYYNQRLKPEWVHVRAHKDNDMNNLVDKIANLTSKNSSDLTDISIYNIISESDYIKKNFSNYKINILSFELNN